MQKVNLKPQSRQGWRISESPYLFPCTTAPGSLDKASSSCTSSTRVLKHTLFTLRIDTCINVMEPLGADVKT